MGPDTFEIRKSQVLAWLRDHGYHDCPLPGCNGVTRPCHRGDPGVHCDNCDTVWPLKPDGSIDTRRNK